MGEISSEFREECLRIHNEYRAVHRSPALALDKKLNEFAQTRATLYAEGDYVSLGESIPYGENVFMRRTTDPDFKITAEEAVQAWLVRRKYYDFAEPQPANLTVVRKFTQLVWKNSKKLGVGMVTSSNGTIYVVCNYDPAGNEEYQFADNVLPAKEEDEAEVETPETVELLTVEPQEEVVEALDRLYAVPSEKLRVWTVWLCKIGDEAGEWYKWIHVHTDLIVRMADILRMVEEEDEKKARAEAAEERSSKSKDSGERRSKVSESSERRSRIRDSERGSARSKSKESTSRAKSKDSARSSEEQFYDARTSSTLDKDTQSEAASVEQKKSTVSQRSEGGTDKQEESEEAKPSEDGTEKPEESEEAKPSEDGTEVEDSADIFARESEQAEQAEQETPVEKSASKASRLASEASAKEGKSEESVPEEDVLPVGVKWKPLGEPEEEVEEEEEIELLEIPTCREEMMLYKKDFMHQATIYISLYEHWKETAAQAIKELMGRQVMPTSVVHEIDVKALLKKNGAKNGKKLTPPEDMEDFIRDMARAEQDIPYIFYLKAEPNIDIAIEFGAEELYELPRREHIYGDYKCLYFNLIDKPGTLDEPESLINKPIEEENKDETD